MSGAVIVEATAGGAGNAGATAAVSKLADVISQGARSGAAGADSASSSAKSFLLRYQSILEALQAEAVQTQGQVASGDAPSAPSDPAGFGSVSKKNASDKTASDSADSLFSNAIKLPIQTTGKSESLNPKHPAAADKISSVAVETTSLAVPEQTAMKAAGYEASTQPEAKKAGTEKSKTADTSQIVMQTVASATTVAAPIPVAVPVPVPSDPPKQLTIAAGISSDEPLKLIPADAVSANSVVADAAFAKKATISPPAITGQTTPATAPLVPESQAGKEKSGIEITAARTVSDANAPESPEDANPTIVSSGTSVAASAATPVIGPVIGAAAAGAENVAKRAAIADAQNVTPKVSAEAAGAKSIAATHETDAQKPVVAQGAPEATTAPSAGVENAAQMSAQPAVRSVGQARTPERKSDRNAAPSAIEASASAATNVGSITTSDGKTDANRGVSHVTASDAGSDSFAMLDVASRPSTTWVHADAHRAEAGFQDPDLGWVRVRAEVSAGSEIHAAVVPDSEEAARVLGTHMAGLNNYLAEHRTPVESLTLGSPETGQQGMSNGADGRHAQSDRGPAVPEFVALDAEQPEAVSESAPVIASEEIRSTPLISVVV